MTSNFNTKCRTCLSDSNNYHQLCDYVDKNYKILEMLDSCVPHIDAKNSLQFSNLMCQPCVDKLLSAYKFQEMCIKSNEHLSTLLFKAEPEEILVQTTDEPSIQIKDEIVLQSNNDYEFLPNDLQQEVKPVYDGNAGNVADSRQFNQFNTQKEVSGTVCSICGKKFRHNSWLKQHMVTHSDERPFQCTQCDKSFPSERYLKYHIQVHSKETADNKLTKEIPTKTAKFEKKYTENNQHKATTSTVCSICGKYFRCNSWLQQHMVTHTDERPFQCPHCDKSFPSERYLKYHLQVHNKKCSEDRLTKKFFTKTANDELLEEIPTKTANIEKKSDQNNQQKPTASTVCSICGKYFRCNSWLQQHMVTHTDERPFQCPHCDKSFPSERYLKYHLHSHTQVYPFKCTQCSKSFRRPYALRNHLRVHSDETPFKCPQCGRPYKFLYNLNRHMQTHADAKKYECKFCPRHFYIKSIWEKHDRSHSDRHNVINKNSQQNEESSSNELQEFSDNEVDEEEHKEQIKVPLITAKEELKYIQQIFEITMPDLD